MDEKLPILLSLPEQQIFSMQCCLKTNSQKIARKLNLLNGKAMPVVYQQPLSKGTLHVSVSHLYQAKIQNVREFDENLPGTEMEHQ
jgi:hypothetical protein